jgi:DNA helicase-2/ATP-dependent DNA helicase PcrA
MVIASAKQNAIYDTWLTEDCNILIRAVAGSGKTTTLLKLLEYCQHRTLFLAFNKSIQVEIQEKIEKRGLAQGKALTMHSLGLQAVRKKFKARVNSNKNFDLIKKLQDENYFFFKNVNWETKLKISFTIIDMNDVSRLFLTDDIEEIKVYMNGMNKAFFDVDVDGESAIELLWDSFLNLREQSYAGRSIEVDFHDMIYVPVRLGLVLPIFPYYLMVDEAQDLNLLQHKFIDKLISQGTIQRWIAVGDSNQSIYGFSGAYTSSFEKFLQKDNVKEMPLDICYRCPIDVVNSANEVYPVMEAHKNYTGVVRELPSFKMIKDKAMVICRNSAPLFELYFMLLAEDRQVYIKGEDILGSMMKFMKPYNYKTVSDAYRKMERELGKLASDKDKSDNARFKYYVYLNNYNIFGTLIKKMAKPDEPVKNLVERLKNIFSGGDDAITLSTIHKSKGLEADVVCILNEHLIPSKFASSDEQLRQEMNLKYVARTRAREEMYFLNI